MISSMTGFGEADCEVDGISYTVEVKTVNNRYYKSSIRLPDMVAFLEEDIEKLLRNNLSRGTVSYNLRLKNVAAKAMFDIDETAIKRCVERLSETAKQLNDWIFTTFAVKAKNAWPLICEQTLCMAPMNCHTLNYANLLVDLYKATGENRYSDAAISTTRAGFTISGDKDGWGWYSLKTSPLYFGIDLVRELNLK